MEARGGMLTHCSTSCGTSGWWRECEDCTWQVAWQVAWQGAPTRPCRRRCGASLPDAWRESTAPRRCSTQSPTTPSPTTCSTAGGRKTLGRSASPAWQTTRLIHKAPACSQHRTLVSWHSAWANTQPTHTLVSWHPTWANMQPTLYTGQLAPCMGQYAANTYTGQLAPHMGQYAANTVHWSAGTPHGPIRSQHIRWWSAGTPHVWANSPIGIPNMHWSVDPPHCIHSAASLAACNRPIHIPLTSYAHPTHTRS